MHTANLDKKGAIQLNWLIDWPNEQVFFYVKNALELSTGHNLFYIGFSQRGNVPNSDLCLFQRLGFNDIVTVSRLYCLLSAACRVPASG